MTAQNPELAIRAQGLSKNFGSLRAVDNLDLNVRTGEAFALVGPDGAGKTTTIRLLCGIMNPDRGRAEVLGHDTVRATKDLKAQIGYLPQRFGLYNDLTVGENIAFYADLYQVTNIELEQRLPELLSFSDLGAFQSWLAGNLSGGMRQKLSLICALIHKPRLLFLDEPTYGVDPISRREFWEILYRLLGEGLTIFLSTAYMDEAERAHEVGLIHRGELLLTGSPQAIKATFKGELLEIRTHDLRSATKVLNQLVVSKGRLVQQVHVTGERLLVTVNDSSQALEPLREALQIAGLGALTITSAAPGLEDLFVQMITSKRV